MFFSGIPSLNSQTIVFHLVPTLNHHDIASKASVTAVSVTASGSPCPQCQRVRRPGCTLHTLEWKDRGSFLWFQPRWGSLGGSPFATLGRQDLIFKPCICPYDFRLGLEIQFNYHDVRLLSLTAIKGWKSQHWFIWRVLSPSGPFQALTKITEKDQQDQ